MTQICLLNSSRLSSLLQEALSWNEATQSLIVSAQNGSILAYAFRGSTPSTKTLRTISTTMTAAYSVASEDVLIFEAQTTGSISVIAPIGDHVLLAVTGPERTSKTTEIVHNGEERDLGQDGHQTQDGDDMDQHAPTSDGQSIRTDLETVNQELSTLLRSELNGLRWPNDI